MTLASRSQKRHCYIYSALSGSSKCVSLNTTQQKVTYCVCVGNGRTKALKVWKKKKEAHINILDMADLMHHYTFNHAGTIHYCLLTSVMSKVHHRQSVIKPNCSFHPNSVHIDIWNWRYLLDQQALLIQILHWNTKHLPITTKPCYHWYYLMSMSVTTTFPNFDKYNIVAFFYIKWCWIKGATPAFFPVVMLPCS